MKKKIILFCACLIAVGSIAYSGASNKSLMNEDSKSDVYYDDTGWIEMGKVDSQTWYEYYVSLVQSGLNPPSDKGYQCGVYCLEHPELANADVDEIVAAAKADGAISNTSNPTTSNESVNNSKTNTNSQSTQTNNVNNSSNNSVIKYDLQRSYVVTSKKAVYDKYDSSKSELGSLSKGTEVSVIGETTNGYYVFEYTLEDGTVVDAFLLFKGKTNIVPKDEYDAAWAETSRIDATCENDGYIEYTNSLSDISYKDAIEATGHVTSANSTYEVVKPGVFKNGKTIIYCDKCGQIAREENIDSYFKTQTLLVILIGVFGVVLIISVFYLIKKKRMEVMG
ncbi:hypothetical protein SAMN02910377_00093 [Pseudobutyrivibrio ruminis]|uniref:SH3 domain-containing protein n=2 Tax=Pseudobutyrivibrio ruminis TaxID=46206 RepID=A0A1H7F104_9FIRM|nr:hypothetical protein [Pseudobutyrivibrio ruminis]SEK17680.1 hypothetical protein SAMN02910377_00093 [Pseudobutyrivibrio ruminis]